MEKVIKDTESLFKTREKEYQETIDQIEVRLRAEAEGPRFSGGPEWYCRTPGPLRFLLAEKGDLRTGS